MDRNGGILIVVCTVLLPTRVKLLLSDGHRYLGATRHKFGRDPGKLTVIPAATVPAEQERGSARVSVEVYIKLHPYPRPITI
jgi:hypothetical protein